MSPFDGISEKEIEKLKIILNSHIYSFSKDEEIITMINSKNIFGIFLTGAAKLVLNSYTGEEILIENYYKDSVFGTNISDINNQNTKMYALTSCKIAVFDYNTLISDNLYKYDYYNKFIKNLFQILVIRSNEFNYRIRILTKKSIRDRLIEYFNIEYEKKHNKTFNLSMSLKDLADYISVNRSAMFREIKYLKEDNLINIENHKVTINYN